MRCIIAGPRDFTDYKTVCDCLDKIFSVNKPDVVISGGATGVDFYGEMWARKNEIDIEIYAAKWTKFGNSAGPKRNDIMAQKATHCVVIWKGNSKGSKNMIETAKKYNLVLREVLIN